MKREFYSILIFCLLFFPVSSIQAQPGCSALFDFIQVTETLQVNFTDVSVPHNNIISWSWNFGDGHTSTLQHPTNVFSQAGNYNVCLTVSDNEGCQSTICHTVTVEDINHACHAAYNFGQTPNTTFVSFFDHSTSDNEIISWNWDFGDGTTSTEQNPMHNYESYGNYYACLTIEDNQNCQSMSCHHVILDTLPGTCHAGFTYVQTLGSFDITFTDQSESENQIVSWLWNFGDGHTSSSANPEHTYDQAGVYTVCLLITDNAGCENEFCHPVTVTEISGECLAFFVSEQSEDLFTIHFTDSSGGPNPIIAWFWDFGDGQTSIEQNPSHTFTHEGHYQVCLTITDSESCESTFCQHLLLEAASDDCHAAFSYVIQLDSMTVVFTDSSQSSFPIIQWLWTTSDGFIYVGPAATHTFSHPGHYQVCLSILDDHGCHHQVCESVSIGNPVNMCNALFHVNHTSEPLTLHFTDASTSNNPILTWSWTFGDGGIDSIKNPTHTYQHEGTYEVCLTIVDNHGCQDVSCHHVVVNHTPPACHANFLAHIGHDGYTVNFQNISTGDIAHSTWLWDFGDGFVSNEASVQHIFSEAGIYTVCLFMTDTNSGCSSHYCHPFSIHMSYHETNPHYAIQTFRTEARNPEIFRSGLKLISVTNPVTEEVRIAFSISTGDDITVDIHDLTGNNLLREIINDVTKGDHFIIINMPGLQTGLFVLTVSTDTERETRRLTVIK